MKKYSARVISNGTTATEIVLANSANEAARKMKEAGNTIIGDLYVQTAYGWDEVRNWRFNNGQ